MKAIQNHKRGDTWNGIELLIEDSVLSSEGVETFYPVDLTGCSVISKFKTDPYGFASFEFKTENNTITIPNPLNGKILFMPMRMDVPSQCYIFDVQITYPNGSVKTIYDEETYLSWEITQDIS